ncbi:hypothetical protein AWC22_10055 [Mycobacterium riyadhense]|uniref:Uncharacterized protein n=1 Tax=Mycobacterium riyadhense TaxID=486698 RepID=A0A1X2DGX4_9MYCO|nr:hypothetical protein AWC22_10055 [Mycobacterium riyadhense]
MSRKPLRGAGLYSCATANDLDELPVRYGFLALTRDHPRPTDPDRADLHTVRNRIKITKGRPIIHEEVARKISIPRYRTTAHLWSI